MRRSSGSGDSQRIESVDGGCQLAKIRRRLADLDPSRHSRPELDGIEELRADARILLFTGKLVPTYAFDYPKNYGFALFPRIRRDKDHASKLSMGGQPE
jgi:hypothetical protein